MKNRDQNQSTTSRPNSTEYWAKYTEEDLRTLLYLARSRIPEPQLNLADFAKRFLRAEKTTGIFIPLEPANALHEDLARDCDSLRTVRAQKRCYLAPRGSAKTTWLSYALPICAAVQRWETFILLLADTGDQAEEYLTAIKAELEDNEALAEAYPSAAGRGPTWQKRRIVMANGVQIAAFGTHGRIRGRKQGQSRPSLVIGDDLQNKDHIISELQRENSWRWLTRDVLNVGNPETSYIVAGTALHRDAIVCRLQTPQFGSGWTVKKYQAIIEWPKRLDLWSEWESILHAQENENREADALAFYQSRLGEMNE